MKSENWRSDFLLPKNEKLKAESDTRFSSYGAKKSESQNWGNMRFTPGE